MASGATEAEREQQPKSPRGASGAVSLNKDADMAEKQDLQRDQDSAESSPSNGIIDDRSESEDGGLTSEKDSNLVEDRKATSQPSNPGGTGDAPPLPNEAIPPLPTEPPPATIEEDDGWAPVWEESAQAFYFYNRFTGATQWTNPRVPEVVQPGPPGVEPSVQESSTAPASSPPTSGYNPAIHGDYDPTAWYAQPATPEQVPGQAVDPAAQYAATAAFNRFTGKFQAADVNPENHNDENKSKRQMNAFFDVDAAANSHDGRSLKAERSGKKLSKTELKQFKEKRKARKEEKRRAWLRD